MATDPELSTTLTYTWTITGPSGSTFATVTGAQAELHATRQRQF